MNFKACHMTSKNIHDNYSFLIGRKFQELPLFLHIRFDDFLQELKVLVCVKK